MAVTYRDVVELYVTMFQRAPEQEGVVYWFTVANTNNLSRQQLASEMAKAAVSLVSNNSAYQSYYPEYAGVNLSSLSQQQATAIISKMYEILFNKSYIDDPNGVNYWVDRIVKDKVDFGTVVVGMLDAAKTYLNSSDPAAKAAAQTFMNRVDAAEQISYIIKNFNGNFNAFQQYVKVVDYTSSSVEATVINAAKDYPAFTPGADNVTGTIYNDIFYAPSGTLQTSDTANGGAGEDQLWAEINATNATPQLKNIEVLKLTATATGSQLDLSNSTGINKIYLDTTSKDATISGLNSAGINLFVSGSSDATFEYKSGVLSGTSDSVNVTLEGFTASTVPNLTLQGGDANEGIETLNLNSTKSANSIGTLSVSDNGSTATLQNLIITGDKDLTIGSVKAASNKNFTLNATGLNAKLTATIDANSAKDVTINTTNKDDSITISSTITGNLNITTGDGNDTIDISGATVNGNVLIDAGNGNDTINLKLGANNDTIVLNKSNTGYDTISNFNTGGSDKLKIKGLIGFAVDVSDVLKISSTGTITDYTDANSVLTGLSGSPTSNVLGNDDNIVIIYDGSSDSYVYYYSDANNNGKFDTGDKLQLLAKVASVNLTVANITDILTT